MDDGGRQHPDHRGIPRIFLLERQEIVLSQPFSGGIAFPHDVENKAATSALPIENFTPARLVIPLRQGFGAACVPVEMCIRDRQKNSPAARIAAGLF